MNDEMQVLKMLRDDFSKYASQCLKITTKDSQIVNLNFNFAQQYLHNKITEHKKRTGGKLRMAVLKARQFGISTYTEARFLWITIFNEATNAFIMADSRSSASNIFEMTKRYYEHLPKYLPKPELKKSNERSLVFDGIDSSFRVGTAGAKTTGRSMTNQLLHCSEVAFWENANDIITGLFQTVPDNNESEIIYESTANGVGGLFYNKIMQGLEEGNEWETIFLPWYWHPEYSKIIPEGFRLTDEEMELKALYGLNDSQLCWRRNKIESEFKDREYLFAQEYPISINEAFISTQHGLIKGKYLEKARKSGHLGTIEPRIMGVDPARDGDRTIIAIRQGRHVEKILKYTNMESQQLAGIVKQLISKESINKCFIDVGCGYGTIDRLKEDGYGNVVTGIPFNSGAEKKELYTNKRSEMFGDMRDWFMQDGGGRIPDDENIVKELSILPDMKMNGNEQFSMIHKEEIKKINGGLSTDIADAIALTFATKVMVNVIRKSVRYSGRF